LAARNWAGQICLCLTRTSLAASSGPFIPRRNPIDRATAIKQLPDNISHSASACAIQIARVRRYRPAARKVFINNFPFPVSERGGQLFAYFHYNPLPQPDELRKYL